MKLDKQLMLALGAALERMDGSDMLTTERSIPGYLILDDGRSVQVFIKLYEVNLSTPGLEKITSNQIRKGE